MELEKREERETTNFKPDVLIQLREDKDKGGSKWYKISSSTSHHLPLDPVAVAVAVGPRDDLEFSASVAFGSKIYVMGGVENTRNNKDADMWELLSNKVYCKRIIDDDEWIRLPDMLRARGGHHAVVAKGKLFVFGSSIQFLDWPWSKDWGEFLDLSDTAAGWQAIHCPKFHSEDIAGVAVAGQDEAEILVYFQDEFEYCTYNIDRGVWRNREGHGCYHSVACNEDGFLFGAGYVEWEVLAVYVMDVRSEGVIKATDKKRIPLEHSVKNLENITNGRLISLMPIGHDRLGIWTVRKCEDFSLDIICQEYEISSSIVDGSCLFSARILDVTTYRFCNVISVQACLTL